VGGDGGREKAGIKSVCLVDCFQLCHEWMERTQTTSNQQRTFQHYIYASTLTDICMHMHIYTWMAETHSCNRHTRNHICTWTYRHISMQASMPTQRQTHFAIDFQVELDFRVYAIPGGSGNGSQIGGKYVGVL